MVTHPPANARDARDPASIPGCGRFPGEGNGNPLPVFLPGKFHGERSLVGYSPWGRKELDTTEQLFHFFKARERDGKWVVSGALRT